MKKIITRFLILGCLFVSLGVLSFEANAQKGARPAFCLPVCVDSWTRCYPEKEGAFCVINPLRCFSDPLCSGVID